MADVVIESELGVVDPYRSPVIGHPLEALAISGYVLELPFDMSLDPCDVNSAIVRFQGRSVEDGHPRHMHMTRSRFERQEGRIEVAERLVVELIHRRSPG